MAKLVEDQNIKTFSADDEVAHDTFLNELQNQLRGTHKSLWRVSSYEMVAPSGSSWILHANGEVWTTNVASDSLYAPVPLRAGQKITDVEFVIHGDAGAATGGSIKLRRRLWIVGEGKVALNSWTEIYNLGGTNPWDIGAYFDRVSVSGLSIIIEPEYTYQIQFISSTATQEHMVADLAIVGQLGN